MEKENNKKILSNLISTDYEHPFDKKALDKLEGTPGLELLTKKYIEYSVERLIKILYTGSSLKVTNRNFPELYNLFINACKILNVSKIPDLYLQRSYDINAFTTGDDNPVIVLNTGCIDWLEDDELLFIIGHELGHIKSKHVRYHQMAMILPIMGNIIGNFTLGIGSLISKGLELALLHWYRMSEFTADRAGLLCCQDVNTASKVLVKMSGVPQKYYNEILVEEFIKQAKEFESYDFNTYNKIIQFLSTIEQSHPWTVLRGMEFFKWIETNNFDRILKSNEITTCPDCDSPLNGDETFCSNCGFRIKRTITPSR